MTLQETWECYLRSSRAFTDYTAALIEGLRANWAGDRVLSGRWLEECQRLGNIHSECFAALEETGFLPLAHLSEDSRLLFEEWYRTHGVMEKVQDFCMDNLKEPAPGADLNAIEGGLEMYRALRDREISKWDALIEEIAAPA
jgi:hypothetical protein